MKKILSVGSVLVFALVFNTGIALAVADNPVTTNLATKVTSTSAIISGTVGGANADLTNLSWGTKQPGSVSAGVDLAQVIPSGSTGAGVGPQSANTLFSYNDITSLTPGTKYYFIAWVHVNGMWYPGTVQTFTTLTTVEQAALVAAQSAAHTALNTNLGTYTSTNYTVENWTILTGYKTAGDTAIDSAVDSASVILAQNTAITEMAGVVKDLADAKTAALSTLAITFATYTQANYTAENWTTLTGFKTDGDTAIDAAGTTGAVTSAQNTATTGMAGVLKTTQIIPVTASDGSGDVTISSTTPEVVITNPTQAVDVTISNGTTNPTIDVSSFVSDNGNGGVGGNLPEINITSAVAYVAIPATTLVTGPSGWDGIIDAPTAGTPSGTPPAGFSVGGTVISIGSSDGTLIFDKPVTILLAGVTGTVGYRPSGSDIWQTITNVCGGSYDTPTSPTAPGECAINNGTDTKIVTYHFTSFGGLNIVPASPNGSGALVSGGGSSYVASIVTTPTPTPTTAPVGQVLGASTSPTSTAIPGCDSRTTGFSTTTGQSCIGNTGTTAPIGQVLGAGSFHFTLTLRVGSKGNEVVELQNFLNNAGYNVGTADGKFGAKTKVAVIKFQVANKLKGDGVVGPKVRALLNQ